MLVQINKCVHAAIDSVPAIHTRVCRVSSLYCAVLATSFTRDTREGVRETHNVAWPSRGATPPRHACHSQAALARAKRLTPQDAIVALWIRFRFLFQEGLAFPNLLKPRAPVVWRAFRRPVLDRGATSSTHDSARYI